MFASGSRDGQVCIWDCRTSTTALQVEAEVPQLDAPTVAAGHVAPVHRFRYFHAQVGKTTRRGKNQLVTNPTV